MATYRVIIDYRGRDANLVEADSLKEAEAKYWQGEYDPDSKIDRDHENIVSIELVKEVKAIKEVAKV